MFFQVMVSRLRRQRSSTEKTRENLKKLWQNLWAVSSLCWQERRTSIGRQVLKTALHERVAQLPAYTIHSSGTFFRAVSYQNRGISQ